MKNIFDNKTILITGGVGSIGSVIVEKLLNNYSPKQVRIFDNNEEAIFEATCQFASKKSARFLIGDIRDKERIEWAMQNVDIVFHSAALKHVAINEYNPFEAIKTNVLGTENVVMAAIKGNIEKFINISTDKASVPTSTMGASKLLAERITMASNYYKGKSKTICASVRFGNVIGSSGSVVPLFCRQIKKGGPVTLTDKRMIRYFMTISQAVSLIFDAVRIARGGEVFILKMPSLKIEDLAEVLIKELAEKSKKIKIKEVGRRPGEKIYESLINPNEMEYILEMGKMFIIPPIIEYPNLSPNDLKEKYSYYFKLGAKRIKKIQTKNKDILNKKEIKKLLREAIII